MNKEFLERLYWACSFEAEPFEAGLNLSEMFEHFPQTNETWYELKEKLKERGLEADDIGDELSVFSTAYEKQGFINGFRLGMKLAGELREEDQG